VFIVYICGYEKSNSVLPRINRQTGYSWLGMESQYYPLLKFAEIADYAILQSFEEVLSELKITGHK